MALQVWLPLNGDINNQGVSDVVTTQSTAPSWISGKVTEKAMSTGAFYLPASQVSKFYNNSAMSFAFWIYPTTNASTGTPIIGQSNTSAGDCRMFTIFQYPTALDLHLSWQAEGGDSFLSSILTNAFVLNTWNHCVVTYNGSQAKVYINGVLKATYTGTSTRTNFSYNVPIPSTSIRYLNDIRIYDHVLSEKEIKELSKGLALHYPLNCNGNGVPNLADNSGTFDGWSAADGWSKGTSDDGSVMYSFSRTGATSNNWYRLIPTVKINGNNYPNGITVSMELLTPDKSAINQRCLGSIQTYQANGSRIGWAEPGWDLTNVVNNKWSKVTYNFTQANLLVNNTSGTTYSYTQFSFQLVQNGNISIRKIKIEPGNTRTPYSLSLTDINDSTEYDTSGYKNNGDHASITIDGSSPRYDASVNYNTANSTTVVGNCFALNSQIPEITVNVWFKTNTMNNTAPNLFSLGQNDFLRARIASSTSVWQYYSVAGTICYNTYSCKNILDNIWHMYTYTFNKGTEIVYIDGAQVGTANNSSTGTYLKVGAISWNLAGFTSGSEKYIGNLSDFRIYSTALTATDIKELYEVSASLDKNGNVWGYELVEDV